MRAFVMWIGMMVFVLGINLATGAVTLPSMNFYRWVGVALIIYMVIYCIVMKSIDLNWIGFTFIGMGILYIIFGKPYIF